MKKIDGYWVDSNYNRWECNLFSKKEAERFSKTLSYCYHCTNCRYCTNCNYCTNCGHCDNCISCNSCRYCKDCYNCDYCFYCVDCVYCYSCLDFKENPRVYTTKKIGGRNSQTTFYYGETDKGMEVKVVCGCFIGNLEEFENAVLETHKDNDKYREQYLKEISKVKMLFDLN